MDTATVHVSRTDSASARGSVFIQRLADKKVTSVFGLIVFLFFGGAFDASIFFRYPVPVGLDGYYYVLQINSFLTSSHFYYPTRTPVVLYGLCALSFLTANPTLVVKIVSILLHASLCAGVFVLTRNALGTVWLSLLGVVLAELTRLHLFMTAEFVNNLGALSLVVWTLVFSIRFLQKRRRLDISIAAVLTLAALFSHRSTGFILVAILWSVALFHWFVVASFQGRTIRYAVVAAAVSLFAPAVLAAQPFFALPSALGSQLTMVPDFTLFTWFLPEAIQLFILLIGTALVLSLRRITEWSGERAAIYLAGSTGLTAIFFQNPFFNGSHGMASVAGRIFILVYVQTAVLAPALIFLVMKWRPRVAWGLTCVVLLLVGFSAISEGPAGLKPEVLTRRVRLTQALTEKKKDFPSNAIVIAEHGDEFAVTATTGRIAAHDPIPGAKNDTTYWLLDLDSTNAPLEGLIVSVGEASIISLVTDEALRNYLARASRREKLRLFAKNIHVGRAARITHWFGEQE